MIDLAEFLLARIAEDEADAREHQTSQEWVQEAAGWWDCDRVLAECEAKRRIVAAVSDDTVICEVVDPVLRALALPYADHPDYRDEWRPDGLPSHQYGPTADYGEG